MKTKGGRSEKQLLQERHISAWRQSGLSQSQYCRQHKLHPSTFAGWLSRLPSIQAWPVALVPVPDTICKLVQAASAEPESAGFSLIVGRRCRIEIGRQFDAGTLTRLVAVLEDM